jgi:imidazole glycerol-phosphate synthase subunit HisH
MRIALIDYRAGNLTSVKKAFAAVGADLFVPAQPSELADAAAVVVPGVGHFGATATLDDEWARSIRQGIDAGRPLLGICLGMQWLFEGSAEAPDCAGLGVLAGQCYRLPSDSAITTGTTVKIPHVGWNALDVQRADSIVAGVPQGSQVYFTHSFAAPITDDTVAFSVHGQPFAAIVQRGRVAGVQFHPEKSGEVGLRILRNFLGLADG